jgi:hypothetical protein
MQADLSFARNGVSFELQSLGLVVDDLVKAKGKAGMNRQGGAYDGVALVHRWIHR